MKSHRAPTNEVTMKSFEIESAKYSEALWFYNIAILFMIICAGIFKALTGLILKTELFHFKQKANDY